ncbi:hypothetical protein [Serratia liquefaciens]|uniref:hypothetical protein n=1 Tax=Serratia liquefaciens TaxID=614 RepID=UPI000AEA4D6C|nr:hypothetical protein [Serratia liquefaciens]
MCVWKQGFQVVALLVYGGLICSAQAADRGSITQQQKMLLEQAQQQREALQNNVSLLALPLPAPPAAGEACQLVRQIKFQGA